MSVAGGRSQELSSSETSRIRVGISWERLTLCLSRKWEAWKRWFFGGFFSVLVCFFFPLMWGMNCQGRAVTEGNVGAGMNCHQLGMDSGWKPEGSPNGEENGAELGCPAGNSLGFIPHGTQFILGHLFVNSSARAVGWEKRAGGIQKPFLEQPGLVESVPAMAGKGNEMGFKVPPNLDHSRVLWLCWKLLIRLMLKHQTKLWSKKKKT